MIVVDTNIIAYLFIKGENTNAVKRILIKDNEWISSILWRSEFRSVLSFYIRQKHFSTADAKFLMEEAERLMQGNEYHVHSGDIMDLCESTTLSAYDCEFVALAGELDIPLVTSDRKILKAAPDIAVSVKGFLG